MYIGKSYNIFEFLTWTKAKIYTLLFLGFIPVCLYHIFGVKWVAIPWSVIAMLGTATAFILAFKNNLSYNRSLEAQEVWTTILSNSRSWGLVSQDYIENNEASKTLIYNHLAWITALRYSMRTYQSWETTDKKHNINYRKHFKIPEQQTTLEEELAEYVKPEMLENILKARNTATYIMSLQSKTLKSLYEKQEITVAHFIDMEKSIKEFYNLQGKSEHIKHSPFPRQYNIINNLLIQSFSFLLPYGLLADFNKLNDSVDGFMKGNMIWLIIPFSCLISWLYASIAQVGENTENPFEGGANDVPISQISFQVEAELREMLGEASIKDLSIHQNNIIL
ncbi:MAG: multidrug transporter [Chryseobacterium sp.]|uniref:bestrophin family protein n=1 Tax=Chryseobacterium sp. TaxID=1871047 RepID=UPI000DB84F94|nr:bestrophin family ion channel [Chryseobacterium sp.]MPS64960.1 multidrug transporter [Chryseobacterium sp.]PZU13188.1 MAG: multidrug transporter [Chryseobacterium sp.]